MSRQETIQELIDILNDCLEPDAPDWRNYLIDYIELIDIEDYHSAALPDYIPLKRGDVVVFDDETLSWIHQGEND